ncbi:polysaccharide lyase family 7 protein [Cobetia crustatorum]|uniref:Polysaccharide lyase family 7 protein n=1 Tax=Cobetia crustatorum TaxID=553385 RepID=A0A558HPZ4_9GAMM|nr:polysaccharide lyase family 7 protein [Cobetia crustatorum]TVU71205.1 polysaccharide lyase family 7 protein [Cobetia crustatorum]
MHNNRVRHPILNALIIAAGASAIASPAFANDAPPADAFNLDTWKLTLPMDGDGDGKVDEITVSDLQSYRHQDYFYLDDEDHLVFVTPNKAFTTPNSSNSRTELRQMLRGTNTKIGTHDPKNNFALASHKNADKFAQVGGYLEATLRVDHVAERSKKPERKSAFSVVVGQIHAGKDESVMEENEGFGHGNEPLKIFYKKLPDQETGSVFWNYEKNLAKEDPKRTDVSYAVWGHDWNESTDPGEEGIALGDTFSYKVEVKGDIMHLTFNAEGHPTRDFEINLADNVDANGKVDSDDLPAGYAGDWMYFKAGSYNQCNTKPSSNACEGTGEWKTDEANGDYAKVVFTQLDSGKTQ